MRLAIIRDDNQVYVDGLCFDGIDCSGLPENVRAVQWDGVKGRGHIEFDEDLARMPEPIDSIAPYQAFIDAWNAKKAAAEAPPPEPPLAELIATLRKRVDDDAERIRLRYITPGAGMAMTYQEKFTQAQAVQEMGEAAANALTQAQREVQFPTLAASVGIEGATLWDCALLVLARYSQFAALSLVIERARLAGKSAIAAAPDVASARQAYENIQWPT